MMLLTFDFSSDIPIFMQLHNQVVVGIAEGGLEPGEKLPSVRALADEAGINVMTVSKAYQLLNQEGYIITNRGRGAVVSSVAGKAEVKDKDISDLRLCLSKLRLSGMDSEAVISLCRKLCEDNNN